MKFQIAFLAALAAFTFTLTSLAAVPPAPAQAVAAAQGAASPQAGVPPGTTYTYTYSGPANPAVLPASPTTGRPDASRSKWSDDRWWYFTPDSRWLLYGQNGWSNPAAKRTRTPSASPAATSMGRRVPGSIPIPATELLSKPFPGQ